MKALRKILLGLYGLALAAMAFWVVVWPLLIDFDGDAGGMRAGHLLTLFIYLGVIAVLCALRVREQGR
ncbi:MAG: hypothetical protein R3174_08665 [Gammaproteobacteria bacterium]|nr:hypothetical protein [Gammaproteobacteria bacterium]